jgi:P-type Ca2+ transporter type 2C
MLGWGVLQGVVVLVAVASIYGIGLSLGMPQPEARALTFAALVVTNFALVLVNRSFGETTRRSLLRPNRALWVVMAVTLGTLAAAIGVPALRGLFGFGPLHADHLGVATLAGVATVALLGALRPRIWTRSA